jgi:hypothetical protein
MSDFVSKFETGAGGFMLGNEASASLLIHPFPVKPHGGISEDADRRSDYARSRVWTRRQARQFQHKRLEQGSCELHHKQLTGIGGRGRAIRCSGPATRHAKAACA